MGSIHSIWLILWEPVQRTAIGISPATLIFLLCSVQRVRFPLPFVVHGSPQSFYNSIDINCIYILHVYTYFIVFLSDYLLQIPPKFRIKLTFIMCCYERILLAEIEGTKILNVHSGKYGFSGFFRFSNLDKGSTLILCLYIRETVLKYFL